MYLELPARVLTKTDNKTSIMEDIDFVNKYSTELSSRLESRRNSIQPNQCDPSIKVWKADSES